MLSSNIYSSEICLLYSTLCCPDSFMWLYIMIIDFQYHISFYCMNILQLTLLLINSCIFTSLLKIINITAMKILIYAYLWHIQSVFLSCIPRSRIAGLGSIQICQIVFNSLTVYKNSTYCQYLVLLHVTFVNLVGGKMLYIYFYMSEEGVSFT